jgi:enoyl-CoA hydratase/carnithine racemase
VKRSLVAAAGGVHRLPVRVPRVLALEIGLTGDPISAERAYQTGLVSSLAEPGEVLDAALALAARISANAPLAVQKTLALMSAPPRPEEEAFKAAQKALLELTATDDFNEGLVAFIEKRPAQWKGR